MARTAKETKKIRTNSRAGERKNPPNAPDMAGEALSLELVVSIDDLTARESLRLHC